jgi:hypothetical protein
MTFDTNKYIEDFENYAFYNQTYDKFTKAPHSSEVRSSIAQKLNNPSLIALNNDSLDSLLLGEVQDSSVKLFSETAGNLDAIINDITKDYDIKDALKLVSSIPYSKTEGNKELNEAHGKYMEGQTLLINYHKATETKDGQLANIVVGKMVKQIFEATDLGPGIKNAFSYISHSQPEILVNIYQNTILPELGKNFINNLVTKDKTLSIGKLNLYVQALSKDNKEAVETLANEAYKTYKAA